MLGDDVEQRLDGVGVSAVVQRGGVIDVVGAGGFGRGGLSVGVVGGKIYRLGGGSLVGSTYHGDEMGVKVVASNLWDLLEYLKNEASDGVSPMWR